MLTRWSNKASTLSRNAVPCPFKHLNDDVYRNILILHYSEQCAKMGLIAFSSRRRPCGQWYPIRRGDQQRCHRDQRREAFEHHVVWMHDTSPDCRSPNLWRWKRVMHAYLNENLTLLATMRVECCYFHPTFLLRKTARIVSLVWWI